MQTKKGTMFRLVLKNRLFQVVLGSFLVFLISKSRVNEARKSAPFHIDLSSRSVRAPRGKNESDSVCI